MVNTQCEAIKDNRMQCGNEAFVSVDDVKYCRLHLNWMIGLKHIDLNAPNSAITVLNPEDQKEVDRIIESGRVEEKAEESNKG